MKPVRFAIAQMNAVVGDIRGNAEKIISWISSAEKENTDLIVFPEAAMTGYPVWDLANKKRFVDECLVNLDRVIASTRSKQITAVVGYIDRPSKGKSRSYNALAWIQNGKVKAKYYKQLLPTYDVFLEDIFFEPGNGGKVIPWNGFKAGPMICEDLWDEDYDLKPIRNLKKQKMNLAVNISASPFFSGVDVKRDTHISKQAARVKTPILYVNQIGAQDDLIFDGRSLFVDASGEVLFRAPAFEEGLFYFDWAGNKPTARKSAKPAAGSRSVKRIDEIYQALVLGVRDYCAKNRFDRVVIGLSGGIDSALVACIAADALSPSAVTGITMPGEFSSEGSWKDSEELAANLGIEFRTYPIREKYGSLIEQYRRQRQKKSEVSGGCGTERITVAMENLQARIRGMELMYVSNDENRLLLTTGNKSELAVGYCTLYGDMAGGLCVIGDVYKTDVFQLAKYRNQTGKPVIPENILTKAPSAELRPDQKDQDSLPDYAVLDEILYLYIEKNLSVNEIITAVKNKKIDSQVVREVVKKVDHNEYKRRQTPPVLRVTEKSWFGRRMPITNRFENSK